MESDALLQTGKKITVLIASYNRGHILEECLQSLQRQTLPLDSFNVIVIDNNSRDNTQEIVTSLAADWPTLRLVFEKEQGLSHARNRGLAEAKTDWIAFLDDDAKAHANWLETILAVIEKDDFDCFGGPYYAWHRFGPPPKWYADWFGTYESVQGYGPLDDSKAYIAGGNCAIRVAAATAVGGFPPEFGMVGAKTGYGEETALFHMMAANGCRLGYVPAMKIDHCVLPYKYSFLWLLRSYFSRGKTNAEIFTSPPVWKAVARYTGTFLLHTARVFYRAVRGLLRRMDADSQKAVAVRIMHASYALGQVWGSFRLAITREKRP